MQSDDYDLDLLDAHLTSADLPDEAMLLSELDGYRVGAVSDSAE